MIFKLTNTACIWKQLHQSVWFAVKLLLMLFVYVA